MFVPVVPSATVQCINSGSLDGAEECSGAVVGRRIEFQCTIDWSQDWPGLINKFVTVSFCLRCLFASKVGLNKYEYYYEKEEWSGWEGGGGVRRRDTSKSFVM